MASLSFMLFHGLFPVLEAKFRPVPVSDEQTGDALMTKTVSTSAGADRDHTRWENKSWQEDWTSLTPTLGCECSLFGMIPSSGVDPTLY